MTHRRPPVSLRLGAAAIATVFAFPAAYLLWRNFTGEASPDLDLLLSSRTLAPLWRTIQLAVTVTAAAGVLGTVLAWLVTRTDLPGRRVLRWLLPLPLVFPTFVGAAAFIRALNPGGLLNGVLETVGVDRTPELRGFLGAFLVLTLFTYPYVLLPVSARLRRMPASVEESARLLGDGTLDTLRRVVLPGAGSAISAGALLVFLYTISDYGAVQLMRYDTLTRAIDTNHLARPALALALSLLLLVLAALVVMLERRLHAGTDSAAYQRSARLARYELGAWRLPALGFAVLVAVLALGAPMVALGDWAADGLLRTSRGGRPLTVDGAKVAEATWNTVQSSVLAAVAAVAVVLPVAFLTGRFRSRLGDVSHAVVIATFALPGILVALALRFWTLRSGAVGDLLFGTHALLIVAYVVRFGSLALGTVLVAVRTVPDRLRDAAATLGADRVRRLATIDLPLMLPGMGAAAGLVLLSAMKELPITLFLAPIGHATLTTRIFSSFEDAFVAEAGIMAVVLVLASGALSWLLVLRNPDAA